MRSLDEPNVKQARALLLVAVWIQRTVTQRLVAAQQLPSESWMPKLPVALDHVLLIMGGAGSGKTTVLLVVEKMMEHFLSAENSKCWFLMCSRNSCISQGIRKVFSSDPEICCTA